MKKRVLITGITGQDGSYLAEFLIKKGYDNKIDAYRNAKILLNHCKPDLLKIEISKKKLIYILDQWKVMQVFSKSLIK